MKKEVRKVDEYFENDKPWNFNGNWITEKEKLAILQNVLENKEIKWNDIPSYSKGDKEFLMSIIEQNYKFYNELPAELAIDDYFIHGLRKIMLNCDELLKKEYENSLEDENIKLSMSIDQYVNKRKIQMVSLFKRKINKSKKELGFTVSNSEAERKK